MATPLKKKDLKHELSGELVKWKKELFRSELEKREMREKATVVLESLEKELAGCRIEILDYRDALSRAQETKDMQGQKIEELSQEIEKMQSLNHNLTSTHLELTKLIESKQSKSTEMTLTMIKSLSISFLHLSSLFDKYSATTTAKIDSLSLRLQRINTHIDSLKATQKRLNILLLKRSAFDRRRHKKKERDSSEEDDFSSTTEEESSDFYHWKEEKSSKKKKKDNKKLLQKQQENDTLHLKIKDLTVQLSNEQNTNQKHQLEKKVTEEKSKETTEELNKLREEVFLLRKSLAEANQTVQETQEELKGTKDQRDTAIAALRCLRNNNAHHRTNLNNTSFQEHPRY